MGTPVKLGNNILLYYGDCRDILPTLITDSVDAVITDPPYGVGIDSWDKEVPYNLITEFLRIAKGSVVWFGSALHIVDDAKAFPVAPDRMMIWSPKFTMYHVAKDGFAYRFHPIWWWRVRKQKAVPWDVFNDATASTRNQYRYSCMKPVDLMVNITLAATEVGNIVLDPFMGSGTTGVACVKTGRQFIGIERDAVGFDIAVKRTEQELLQLRML